ncbi:hypothetical protein Rhe02_51780 [Rhizocola hellebori]|uniref:Uncharacterized protein n=1 Tax=Rhizocola hellebori TaxID=1392758 RepID=A0A8J3QAS3_9ACTN|nr:hypothetical protein [Rhizocola hellebori]GIH07111.1 hypothetical protein Rhe02_51780 [Rhizocola hellebori]
MKVTELLITGFDGDEPVFAVTLVPDGATAVLTATDGEGGAAVDSIAKQETDVFSSVRELLEPLALASANMQST